MVGIPPLPGAPSLPVPPVVGAAPPDDLFNEEDVWEAEHPTAKVDAVRMAMATVNALTEEELPQFFETLKSTMHPDLWELLTED